MSHKADEGEPSDSKNVKEYFYRQFEQEETALREQLVRLRGTTILQPAERASLTDQCRNRISQLSDEVKEASAYLPAYDQRTYSTAVKSLDQDLQEIRNASAPKRKFAFKKRNPTANSNSESGEDVSVHSQAPDTGENAHETIPSREPRDPNGNLEEETQASLDTRSPSGTAVSAVTLTSLSSTYRKFDPPSSKSAASSISITQIHHSAIDLLSSLSSTPFATLSINTVTSSLLLCGRTSGAAHITAVRNSTLVVWSRQLRLHECEDCLVYLRCGSRPIIESCKAIRFTPYPDVYTDAVDSTRSDSPNLWDQVDDFGWLRAEHSPNWKALQPGDEGTIEAESWEIIKLFGSPKCVVSELDGLLRAAKVL